MVRKLSNIENIINNNVAEFNQHLNKILPDDVLDFVSNLQSKTQVYLFSGVIRNYFLKKPYDLRDIDFMIEDDLDITNLFPHLFITKNSFGGYKTKIASLPVDLWSISKTWGLNRGQLKLPFYTPEDASEDISKSIPNTTFFNFSSIIFSMNQRKFIVGKPFLRFLRDKELDVVLEENPYPALCIINSFYYSEKYRLKLSKKLKKYIVHNYSTNIEKFNEIQLKHFERIIYSKNEIIEKIEELK